VNPESRIQNPEFERSTFIALGSNLGNSQELILAVMDRLQKFSSQSLLKSSLWESTPVNCPPGSPDFVNAVVGLIPNASETPETLLEKLQELEKYFGRQPKKVLNEARPLDLDLIAFGLETRDSEFLKLPHPRAHERRFVLQPLSEIAPDLVLPGQTKSVRMLLEELTGDEILRRLSS
jgi:2-amino-4-hydroxy-6-hydroxymethyldihydropteridine diphosphokinase